MLAFKKVEVVYGACTCDGLWTLVTSVRPTLDKGWPLFEHPFVPQRVKMFALTKMSWLCLLWYYPGHVSQTYRQITGPEQGGNLFLAATTQNLQQFEDRSRWYQPRSPECNFTVCTTSLVITSSATQNCSIPKAPRLSTLCPKFTPVFLHLLLTTTYISLPTSGFTSSTNT